MRQRDFPRRENSSGKYFWDRFIPDIASLPIKAVVFMCPSRKHVRTSEISVGNTSRPAGNIQIHGSILGSPDVGRAIIRSRYRRDKTLKNLLAALMK